MSWFKKNIVSIATVCSIIITLLVSAYNYGVETEKINTKLSVIDSKIETASMETIEMINMSSIGLKIFILDSVVGKTPKQLKIYLDSLKTEFIKINVNKTLVGAGLP